MFVKISKSKNIFNLITQRISKNKKMNKKSNEFSGLSMPNFQMYLAAQNFKTLKNVNQIFEAKKRSESPISNQILINNNFINIQTINSATPTFTKKLTTKKGNKTL